MHIDELHLRAPEGGLHRLAHFYLSGLGLPGQLSHGELTVEVGRSCLSFRSAAGRPFYHFAFLVPPLEFDRALARLDQAAELLPDPDSGEVTFEFDFWNANACYALDPVGNIVELIAHRGLDVASTGSGRPAEISEIGLVCEDCASLARELARLEIEIFDGSVCEPASLAFAGSQGRALILTPAGRGWLPTGRAAEAHPIEVAVVGAGHGSVIVPGLPYRVTAR
jgi:hypothetical protein